MAFKIHLVKNDILNTFIQGLVILKNLILKMKIDSIFLSFVHYLSY